MNFEFDEALINYSVFGKGNLALFCFHGFGQNANVYKKLSESLPQYTFYSINLFFHGGSVWRGSDLKIEADKWLTIFNAFRKSLDIETFALIGYSIGCKVALTIYQENSKLVDKLFLIAPDGIKVSIWYKIATYNAFSESVFKKILQAPHLLIKFLDVLASLKLFNKSVVRFVKSQISSQPKRAKVFNTWMAYSLFDLNINSISKHINANKTEIYIFLGSFDRIIPKRGLNNFINQIEPKHLKNIEFKCGHNMLLNFVCKFFQNPNNYKNEKV